MICFVDYRISDIEKNTLSILGFKVITTPRDNNLYSAIDGHVDIQLILLNKQKKLLLINKGLPDSFKSLLSSNNINYIESQKTLLEKYPHNISLNAYITDKYLIHNLNYTDPMILKHCEDKLSINIKQGYSNCSILYVKEKAVITNDSGIHKVLLDKGFDVLLIPYGDISLPDFEYGFIGGVGGMINSNTLAFFGSLDYYAYGEEVKTFLAKYNVSPLYLYEGKLIDRGGLVIL